MRTVLACDLGGTNCRAALVDASGGMLAAWHAPAPPVAAPAPGWAESDADAWWLFLVEAADGLARSDPAAFDAIEAVAICGLTRTQVVLDAAGNPVRPAITFADARAEAEAAAIRDAVPAAERANVNAFHPAARLAWLAAHEPEAMRRAAAVCDPKDTLNARLTGVIATDPISAARLIAVAHGLVPPLRAPGEIVGVVRAGLPGALARLAGRPVLCGCHDSWAAVLGLGALRAGFAYNISGTTEVLGMLGEAPAVAEGLPSLDWGGVHQLGGPGQNGADTAAWLVGLLGDGAVGPALEALLAAPRQARPVLFLPYLRGERVPHWDAGLRGAFLGLDRAHGPGDLAWAVLEGVAALNRVVLERAEAGFGRAAGEVRIGGGAAASAAWCQVKADFCERTIVVGATAEPGLLGAAILAWTGIGLFASLEAAQEKLVRVARRYEPDPRRRDYCRAISAQFRAADAALRPISHALGALRA